MDAEGDGAESANTAKDDVACVAEPSKAEVTLIGFMLDKEVGSGAGTSTMVDDAGRTEKEAADATGSNRVDDDDVGRIERDDGTEDAADIIRTVENATD